VSRRFAADNSEIRFALPAAVDATGAFTCSAVIRRRGTGTAQYIFGSSNAANTTTGWEFGFLASGAVKFGANNSASFINSSETITDTTDWRVITLSKPTGTSQPRIHIKDITTGATATHSNTLFGTVTSPLTETGGNIRIGQNKNIEDLDANLAVVAYWNLNLTDAQADELWANTATSDYVNCSAGAPLVLYELNQPNATDSVPDVQGNGATWAATAGTTVDSAVDPPGWDYIGGAVTPVPPANRLKRWRY
jgi:hypothetical protein